MTDEDKNKLIEIFQIVLDLSDDQDVADLRRIGSDKWDSLAQVSMISAIESVFDVVLHSDHRDALTSFKSASLILDEISS